MGAMSGGITRIDPLSRAMVILNEQQSQVHVGAAFFYNDALTLASSTTQDYLITVGAVAPHIATLDFDGTAVTSGTLYEATDKIGTTLQTTLNANRNSTTAATVTVHKGTSGGTTDGTLLFTYSSGTATVQTRVPAAGAFNTGMILKLNTKYILRLTSGTNGNLCNVNMDWSEPNY